MVTLAGIFCESNKLELGSNRLHRHGFFGFIRFGFLGKTTLVKFLHFDHTKGGNRRFRQLDGIPCREYNACMWEVEYTDEFNDWWETMGEAEHKRISYSVNLLREAGPALSFPHSSEVKESMYGNMRELRSQCEGRPLRTFYAFDPRRTAILLIGGDKTGDDRFYDEMVPKADKIYGEHLKEIQEENNG